VSGVDSVTALLAVLDAPVSPRAAFGEELKSRLLAELERAAMPAVAQIPAPIAARAPRRRRRSRLRIALVAVALLLLLASAAAAAFLVLAETGGGPTLIDTPSNRPASISGIDAEGQVQRIWSCPHDQWCGDVQNVAWAPDGKRIAISLTEFGGHSLYPGLHIVDPAAGRDAHVIGVAGWPGGTAPRTPRQKALLAHARSVVVRFGCISPDEMAWSPDGSKIAYVCPLAGSSGTAIHIMDADGRHPRLLRTGTRSAAWPSWSPAGDRIAFSTASTPRTKIGSGAATWAQSAVSTIYTVGLDGSDRRRVASGAAPAWSADGATIAYRSACAGRVRLSRPDGGDVTPAGAPARCPGIGPSGWPAWSPDGSKLAIGTQRDVYLIDLDGTHLERVGRASPAYGIGSLRPVWQPSPRARS
jgi:Tol biopolymer transport system component